MTRTITYVHRHPPPENSSRLRHCLVISGICGLISLAAAGPPLGARDDFQHRRPPL
jgi:hypothetical protein